MKSIIKNVVVFLIAIIAEIYIFLYLPYYDMALNGDGFYVLFPIMITPLIGLVIGLFIESNYKYLFVFVTLAFSIPFMIIYCFGIDEVAVVYTLAYMFNTAVGIGIGHGIRALVLWVAEKICEHKANKQSC